MVVWSPRIDDLFDVNYEICPHKMQIPNGTPFFDCCICSKNRSMMIKDGIVTRDFFWFLQGGFDDKSFTKVLIEKLWISRNKNYSELKKSLFLTRKRKVLCLFWCAAICLLWFVRHSRKRNGWNLFTQTLRFIKVRTMSRHVIIFMIRFSGASSIEILRFTRFQCRRRKKNDWNASRNFYRFERL